MIKKFKHDLESIFELNNTVAEQDSERLVSEEIIYVDVDKLLPGKYQPRRNFDINKLEELASSIKEHGILQPLLVRENYGTKDYEVVAGERRLRAAKMINMKFVPAILVSVDDNDIAAFSLLENIQRENLNLIEEARGYDRLLKEFNLTHDNIAKKLGKRRSTVTNLLRLLHLPDNIQTYLEENKIQQGHAKVLLGIQDSGSQQFAAEQTIKKQLTVRQLEGLVRSKLRDTTKVQEGHLLAKELEELFQSAAAMPCSVRLSSLQKGTLTISFNAIEEIRNFIANLK